MGTLADPNRIHHGNPRGGLPLRSPYTQKYVYAYRMECSHPSHTQHSWLLDRIWSGNVYATLQASAPRAKYLRLEFRVSRITPQDHATMTRDSPTCRTVLVKFLIGMRPLRPFYMSRVNGHGDVFDFYFT